MMVDAYASRACPCVSAALVSLSCLEPLDMRGLNEQASACVFSCCMSCDTGPVSWV
jgi:hypothetical protein